MVLDARDFLDDDADLQAFIVSTVDDIDVGADDIACQICQQPLSHLNEAARQTHYDAHFDDDDDGNGASVAGPSRPYDPYTASTSSVSLRSASMPAASGGLLSFFQPRGRADPDLSAEPPPRENVFWHTAAAHASVPDNFTPGLIPVLKRALVKTHARGVTRQAFLCCEAACHVATERWDMGWGCGYRNFLMACTALMGQHDRPEYALLLAQPIPPGVRNLQRWIQSAWNDGYDTEGAEQLDHRLVNTRRWIGTGELCTAFTYRGIPSELTDFVNVSPQVILKWVRDYFDPHAGRTHTTNAVDALMGGGGPVVVTKKMPLVLQHAGHSRTIIGVEVNRTGDINLLIFDPSRRPSKEARNAALATHSNALRPVRETESSSLGRVLHPLNFKKRASPSEDREAQSSKKIRVNGDGGAPVDADAQVDPLKLVQAFRLNGSKLGRNSKYQILSFPMTEPYGEAQRLARRELRSQQIRG